MQLDKLAPDIGHAAGGMAGLHQWLLRRPWFDVATGHYRRRYDHSRAQFTKNKERKRDPEMHSTKKGNQYYFGMKAHICVDAESGLVHGVVATAANDTDVTQVDQLLHNEETYVCGDAGYTWAQKRPEHDYRQVIWSISARPISYKKHGKTSLITRVKRKIEYA